MSAGTAAEMLPIFRVDFPEFVSTSDDRVTFFLNLSRNIFYKCQDATLFLTAHLLTLADSSGIGETISSIGSNQSALPVNMAKVGNKQVKFNETYVGKDSQYTTTNYGLIYLQLRDACLSYKLTLGVSGGNNYYGC